MHFTTEQGDAKTVFRLKEERLDSRNAGQLKAEFLILAQPDIDALIVDLALVQHIDSAGISALLLAQRQMKLHSGELRLVGVRPEVLSMLRLTQLDRIFPIYNTVEEALAAEVVLSDDDEIEHEPNLEETDDLDLALGRKTAPTFGSPIGSPKLGPVAPTVSEIKAGAIAAGGSLGAAALAKIMMTPYDDELTTTSPLMAFGEPSLGDDEDFADDDDEDFEDDDFEEDEFEDEDEEDLDEEDDVEEEADEDVVEDDDFEDDDFDDEELEEDEDEDY